MDRETQIRETIREIYDRAKADAQPYVDELVRIKAMEPLRPLVICGKCHRPLPVPRDLVCPYCNA